MNNLVKNDQPGRVLAVFVFAPLLFIKGIRYSDIFLIIFSICLFVWDLYWILFKSPVESKANSIPQDVCINPSIFKFPW